MKNIFMAMALLGFMITQAQAEMPIIEILDIDSVQPVKPIIDKNAEHIIKYPSVGHFYLRAKNRVEALKKDEDWVCIHVSDKNFVQRFLKETGGVPADYFVGIIFPYIGSQFLDSVRTSQSYDTYAKETANNRLPNTNSTFYNKYLMNDFAFNCYDIQDQYKGSKNTFNMRIIDVTHIDLETGKRRELMPRNQQFSLYFSIFFYKDFLEKGLKPANIYMFRLDGSK